jgi:hypothetical protein
MGLIWAVVVLHSAGEQDRDSAQRVPGLLAMFKLCGMPPRPALIWADAGYAGQLITWAKAAGAGGWSRSSSGAMTSRDLQCVATALGRREDVWMARSVPGAQQGLAGADGMQRSTDPHRDD